MLHSTKRSAKNCGEPTVQGLENLPKESQVCDVQMKLPSFLPLFEYTEKEKC